MYDVAPIRMAALKSAHALIPPHPTSWSDGIAAFRELEKALVADAVAAPGEAICHDDELHRLRAQPIHDGCTVDEFSSRVNTALVKTIPFLDRPFSNATAISKWVISQLPAALAPDGRSLRRGLTAAQFGDTKHVVAECILLVQQANEDSQANLRTESINVAEEAGRRPGGLGRGRGRGRGGDGGGGGGGSAGRGRGRSGGRGGGTETHYADGTLRPTSCSVAPPRGPMCDRKHTGACWRDPMCDVALPSRLKPALVKSIDEDRLANARRLGESIKTRQQPASGVVGVMTESDMEQAWECEDVHVFDDADADNAVQTPATTDRKCLACYYDPCVCIAGGIPGTGMDGKVGTRAPAVLCAYCFQASCKCEVMLLQAASEMGAAVPEFDIGEPIRFVNSEQVLVDGAVVQTCGADGNVTVFSGGRQCIVTQDMDFPRPLATWRSRAVDEHAEQRGGIAVAQLAVLFGAPAVLHTVKDLGQEGFHAIDKRLWGDGVVVGPRGVERSVGALVGASRHSLLHGEAERSNLVLLDVCSLLIGVDGSSAPVGGTEITHGVGLEFGVGVEEFGQANEETP